MSYIPSNLYLLSTSPSGVSQWQYSTTDALATVLGASYFADGAQRGMTPGDFLSVVIFTTYFPDDGHFSGFLTYNLCDVTSISGVAATAATIPITATELPAPTASTLGGVKSASAPTNQFMTGINTSGVPQFAQPTSSNVSGLGALATVTPGTNVATALGYTAGAANGFALYNQFGAAPDITISSAFHSAQGLTFADTSTAGLSESYAIWGHTPPTLNGGDAVPNFYFSYNGNASINHPNFTQGDYTWEFGINMVGSTTVNKSVGGIGWAFESSYTAAGSYLQTEAHLIGLRADGTNNRFISVANPSTAQAGGTLMTLQCDAISCMDMSGTQLVKYNLVNKGILLQYGSIVSMYTPNQSQYINFGMVDNSTFQMYSSATDVQVGCGSGKHLILMANAGWKLDYGASVASQWTMADDLNASGNIKIASGKVLSINGATLLTGNSSGYGNPTNGAKQSGFDAMTITLPNLAACVAQLITDLASGKMPTA